jgi:ADP-ribosylglycohydrolase
MLGAIAGDIIGSPYEYAGFKSEDFPLFLPQSTFTDDTVLTVAVADALLNKGDFAASLKAYARKYPFADYGTKFIVWMNSESMEPYHSWGNGAAMRTSPIGNFYDYRKEVLEVSRKCASATHDHPEGIRGAQATSLAVYLARTGASKEEIAREINLWFHYDLSRPLDEIRPSYVFDVSCQGSVPPAITAFLESSDFEDAIRKAVSLGGDADTLACICGSIAEAYYKEVPEVIITEVRKRLPAEFLKIIDAFYARIGGQPLT